MYDVKASTEGDARGTDHPAPDDRLSGRRTAARLVLGGAGITLLLLSLGFLLTHLIDHSGLVRTDLHAERWFAAHRSPTLNHLTLLATWLAETPTAIAVAVVAFFGLRTYLGRWRESWVVAVAVLGELCTFLATTALIDRARPPVHRLDGAPPTSSFPSGHTGAAVAIYATLAVLFVLISQHRSLRWAVALTLLILPFAVGLSRLYRGMHYPTDVIAGALNGSLWVLLAVTTLLPSHPALRQTHR